MVDIIPSRQNTNAQAGGDMNITDAGNDDDGMPMSRNTLIREGMLQDVAPDYGDFERGVRRDLDEIESAIEQLRAESHIGERKATVQTLDDDRVALRGMLDSYNPDSTPGVREQLIRGVDKLRKDIARAAEPL